MGDVAITLKVTPEGTDVDLDGLEGEIRDSFPVQEVNEEKIGFGLSGLEVLIVRDEDEGGTDDIENTISDMEGVTSVKVENVTLI